jgi:hypothetical protein
MDKILLQHACGYGLKWYEATKDRHDEYAKVNGYERVLSTENKTGYLPHWERYRVCLEIWAKRPDALILWVDADCCIATNEDIAATMPASVDLMLLRCKAAHIWRTGVFMARGTDAVKTIFTKVVTEGPVRPQVAPWDDEDRLNRTMADMGYHPYPLQSCWNELVRHTPENYPSFGPEVKIAALHGMTDLIKLAYVMSWAKGWTKYDPKAANDGTPDERDICFYLRSSDTLQLTEQALNALRKYFPNSDVQLVDDGTGAGFFDALSKKYSADLYREPHEFDAATIGTCWHKQLRRYLYDSRAEYLVKIDTDTLFLRSFKRKFPAEGVFGALCKSPFFVHGTFIGIPREYAEKVVASETLMKKYDNRVFSRVDEFGRLLPCEDMVISRAMIDNGFALVDYPEVGNAVIHPVKRII